MARAGQYWTMCGPALLDIAACHASLPLVQGPRERFRVAALSLYDAYWQICFSRARNTSLLNIVTAMGSLPWRWWSAQD